MRTEIVNITPEVAENWLTRNYESNRNIRWSYVDQLADVMTSGRFITDNGQTIVFGEDGTLYDGQHRLSAIVKSGCAQRMLVVYVPDGEKAYLTIDNGTKRQAADFLDGFKDKNSCAAYGKVMACVEWSQVPLLSCIQGKWTTKTPIDRGLIISYCQSHQDEVQDAVRKARVMRDEVGCGALSAYSSFIGIVRYIHNDDLLEEFMDDFGSMAPDNKTVVAAKQMIMRTNIKAGGISSKWLMGTLFDCYDHYLEMDDSVMLNKQSTKMKRYSDLVIIERAKRAGSTDERS